MWVRFLFPCAFLLTDSLPNGYNRIAFIFANDLIFDSYKRSADTPTQTRYCTASAAFQLYIKYLYLYADGGGWTHVATCIREVDGPAL